MEAEVLLKCIKFFKALSIKEKDVTTNDEKANGQKVVQATYQYQDKVFETDKLYYRNISSEDEIARKEEILQYFGEDVYWLDLETHDWPQGSGESDLEVIVIPDMTKNNEFREFLKTLANNAQSGYIQNITAEGRSSQYYHNLENNNHWHDIILMIKAFIDSKGAEIDKKYFSRLVFKWDGNKNTDRGRSTLTDKAYGCSRSLLTCLSDNIKSIQPKMKQKELINILEAKKQIILQGPPGTGKTRLAKLIAQELTMPFLLNTITPENIGIYVSEGMDINTITDYNHFRILKIEKDKIKIQPKGSAITPYVYFSDIIKCFQEAGWNRKVIDYDKSGVGSYIVGIANYIKDRIENPYQKIIQFHPSYSYEDFVRGISAKATPSGVSYQTENRTIAQFAKDAYQNLQNSKKQSSQLSRDNWIEQQLFTFIQFIQTEIGEKGKHNISGKVYIYEADEDCFRYKGDEWSSTGRINFSDLKRLILYNINKEEKDFEITQSISVHGWYRPSYYMPILKEFFKKAGKFVETGSATSEPLKKYVLIIDEINRANLPSVLGELIYALEYRDEPVESMYEIEGLGKKIVLPSNLYIIGTMNSADRSVGHIDYAIRRRFAFADVLPTTEPIKEHALPLFKKVSELFISNFDSIEWSNPKPLPSKYLAPDFRPEDVWIGHSYFITKEGEKELQLKLRYEILPILKEYLKDGILLEDARTIIDSL